jgi:hypothetical protein
MPLSNARIAAEKNLPEGPGEKHFRIAKVMHSTFIPPL